MEGEARLITKISPSRARAQGFPSPRRISAEVSRLRFAQGHDLANCEDERFMRMALGLAARALGRTSPNPTVGSVVVKNGRVVGRGYHKCAGAPHAEIEALREARQKAKGATLYVTLEPCSHVGRTPPCTEEILNRGILRIVIAMRDPNPITNGRGIRLLRRAGIDLKSGVLEEEARALNEDFCHAMRYGRPLVTAKIAQSLDGKISTVSGESKWITSPAARRLAHRLRSYSDAIMVGINTILSDDPMLNVRGVAHRKDRPVKIIVDSRLRTPVAARCLGNGRTPRTIIATTLRHGAKRFAFENRGAEIWALPSRRRRVSLRGLFRRLGREGIHSVLIEGGGEVLAGAFSERMVDRVAIFIAPILIGGRKAASAVGGAGIKRLSDAVRLYDITWNRLGPDLYIEAKVKYPRR